MDIKPRKKRPVNIDIKKPNRALPKLDKPNPNTLLQQRAETAKFTSKQISDRFKKSITDAGTVKQLISDKSDEATTFLRDNTVALIFFVSTTFLALFFYIYRIKTLPQPSYLDNPEFLESASFTDIISNTIFLPQKIFNYLILKLQLDGPTAFKLVSVAFCVFMFVLFFLIIQRWISFRVAALTTFLFASSTLALAVARSSSYDNLLIYGTVILLLNGSVIKNSPRSFWVLPTIFLATLTIYIPGFIWLLSLCLFLFIKPLSRFFIIQSTKSKIIGIFTILLAITPLAVNLTINLSSFKVIAGIPNDYIFNLREVVDRAFELPKQLLFTGPNDPTFWLAGTPILDVATTILATTGVFYLFKDKGHPIRRKVLILFLLTICLLYIVISPIYILMLMPIIYIFAALGITFLLEQWFHIFPKNPFAKSLGYGLMCVLIVAIASYHVSRYFIAWPRNETTVQTFQQMTSDTIDNDGNTILKESL